jgi:hypothetical protein
VSIDIPVRRRCSQYTTAFDAYLQVLDGEADLAVGGKALVASAGEVAAADHDLTVVVHGR